MASPSTIHADPLTPREQEVLRLIAAGQSTKELAFSLGIAFKTAACHRTHVLAKLYAQNTAEAIRNAAALGLLEFPGKHTAPVAPREIVEVQAQRASQTSSPGLEALRAASQHLMKSLDRARTLHTTLFETCCDLRCVFYESRFQRLMASVQRPRNGS